MSNSSASESETQTPTQQLATDDDIDHNDDIDTGHCDENDDSNSDDSNNDDSNSDDSNNDDLVFEHDNASGVVEHPTETRSLQNAETVQVNPNPVVPVLRLND